ncbi:hypothetical protein FJZ28_00640 [Candidatus Peregrinibacteria bacterium]|nr:hypothetical protein [Candidatus Peregrinibacteria bacterium]
MVNGRNRPADGGNDGNDVPDVIQYSGMLRRPIDRNYFEDTRYVAWDLEEGIGASEQSAQCEAKQLTYGSGKFDMKMWKVRTAGGSALAHPGGQTYLSYACEYFGLSQSESNRKKVLILLKRLIGIDMDSIHSVHKNAQRVLDEYDASHGSESGGGSDEDDDDDSDDSNGKRGNNGSKKGKTEDFQQKYDYAVQRGARFAKWYPDATEQEIADEIKAAYEGKEVQVHVQGFRAGFYEYLRLHPHPNPEVQEALERNRELAERLLQVEHEQQQAIIDRDAERQRATTLQQEVRALRDAEVARARPKSKKAVMPPPLPATPTLKPSASRDFIGKNSARVFALRLAKGAEAPPPPAPAPSTPPAASTATPANPQTTPPTAGGGHGQQANRPAGGH